MLDWLDHFFRFGVAFAVSVVTEDWALRIVTTLQRRVWLHFNEKVDAFIFARKIPGGVW